MNGLTDIYINKTLLRQARERAGLTLVDAAHSLGLSKQQLWNYENEHGRGNPSADTMARLCKLYNVNIAALTTSGQQAA